MLRMLALLMGPMFAKEMVEIARRKRYYVNRVLYGVALLIALLVVWESSSWRWRLESSGLLQAMAQLANELFVGVSCVQFGAVFLLMPALLCRAIAGEREAHTLDLLLTTQLKDREIVLGKLGSRLAVMALLAMSGLPVLSMIMLFGGVDPVALWCVQASTLLAMLYAAAHAIYFSSAGRSPLGALVRSYWWMALWMLGLLLLLGAVVDILQISPSDPAAVWVYGAVLVNPLVTFVPCMDTGVHQNMARDLGQWYYPAGYVLPIAWSVLLIWRATIRLRRAPTEPAWLKWIAALWQRMGSPRRTAGDNPFIRLNLPRGPLLDDENPLGFRSRIARVYDREGYLQRIQWGAWALAILFFLLTALAEPSALDDDDAAMLFLAPIWLMLAVLTTVVSAASLVTDRQRGFLELMLATPITPQQFVDGTLLTVWRHLRCGFALAWTMSLVFVVLGTVTFFGALCAAVSATAFGLVIAVSGVLVSLAARDVTTALVAVIIFPTLACVGTASLYVLAEEASGPLMWMITVVALLSVWFWVQRRFPSAWAVGCLAIAVYFAVTGVLLAWTYNGYREEWPLLAMNPAVWSVVPLARHFGYVFHDGEKVLGAILCYWFALAIHFIWARWWTIRNFDRLAGRALRRAG